MDVPPPDDIKTTRAGQIETILADKTPVTAGQVIVRLVGDRPIEAELSALTRDEKKIEELIDAATKRRDAAQGAGNKAEEAKATAELTERQKTLTAKRSQLATRTTDLAKFLIQASSNGTLQQVAKQGQKVAADDVVARLERDAAPAATFAVTDATTFATNTSVELAVGKGEQHVTCTIADVQPDSIKVTCPAEPALSEGTAVTLKVPGTPAETPAPPMPNK
jgi:biotin carboxyl carrier protein